MWLFRERADGGRTVIYTQEVDNYLGLPEANGFDLAQKFEQHAKHWRFRSSAMKWIT